MKVSWPSSEFRERFPASPGELANLRASVRSWAESWDLDPDMTDDALMAISEAAANSIRHAYAEDERGTVEVSIERRGGLLDVAVVDHGQWKGSSDVLRHRGMGRSIIEAVAANYETDIGTDGTVVTFEMPLQNKL